MKSLSAGLLLVCLLLGSCGKEQAPPAPEAKKAAAVAKPVPERKLPEVPQGKLPQMDPDKAKFIAAPSTPKDEEIKKAAKPADATKK